MSEQLEGDRSDQDRHLQLGAEDRRPGRDFRDVDQDPRPELPAFIGLGVSVQGSLVARAAREVAVCTRLELVEREPL
jgi:hypothetical protein